METQPSRMATKQNRIALITAWIITLFVSILPDIILKEVFHSSSPWLFWAKEGFLLLMLLLSFSWKILRPLWKFLFVLFIFFMLEFGAAWLGATALWRSWFAGKTGFTCNLLNSQLLRLIVALLMIGVMLILCGKPRNFFLVKGDLRAQAKPIPLLMDKPTPWSKLGWILAVCITGGTLVFLILAGRPSWTTLALAIPLLPAVLLFALMNSFSEEMNYRSSLLGALGDSVNEGQAILMTSIFFGIGHYYGVPYGIIGVVMASVLGWFLGKSMVETRGFFWAWLIHFFQDVAIFTFIAIGSVVVGG